MTFRKVTAFREYRNRNVRVMTSAPKPIEPINNLQSSVSSISSWEPRGWKSIFQFNFCPLQRAWWINFNSHLKLLYIVKTPQYSRENSSNLLIPYEQARDDGGKENLLFNRKKPPAEPNSGGPVICLELRRKNILDTEAWCMHSTKITAG